MRAVLRVFSFKNLLLLFLISIIQSVSAQNYFSRFFDDGSLYTAYDDFIITKNHDKYLAGNIGVSPQVRLLVSRFDEDDSLLWSKAFEIPASNMYSTSIAELTDSSILITSYVYDLTTLDPSALIIKLNNAGDTMWTQFLGISNSELSLSFLCESNNIIYLYGGSGEVEDWKGMLVAIKSLDGATLWNKQYSFPNYLQGIFYAAKKYNNNFYFLISCYTDSIRLTQDCLLLKTDINGDVNYIVNLFDSCKARSPLLEVSAFSGNIFIGMSDIRNSGLGENYLFCMLDSNLNPLYIKEAGINLNEKSYEDVILNDTTSELIISDHRSILRFDNTGNLLEENIIYWNWINPLAFLSLKIKMDGNALYSAGYARFNNSPKSYAPFLKAELNGVGCYNLPINDTAFRNTTLDIFNDSVFVDSVTLSSSVALINLSTVVHNDSNYCISTNQQEYDKLTLSIYPNPAENILFVRTESKEIIDFEIVDISGRVCHRNTIADNLKTFDISELKSGTYVIRLKYNNGNTIMKKIFIKI